MGPKSSFLVCFMIRFLRLFLPYKCLVWPLPVLHLFHSFHVLILLPQTPAPPQLRISGKLLSPGCLLLQHQSPFDLWGPPCRPRPATHATHTHTAQARTQSQGPSGLSPQTAGSAPHRPRSRKWETWVKHRVSELAAPGGISRDSPLRSTFPLHC